MMRRAFLLLTSLLLVAGCQHVVGPRERRLSPTRVDPPVLTIEEQQQRARENLPLPDQDRSIAPPTYHGLPEPFGRRR